MPPRKPYRRTERFVRKLADKTEQSSPEQSDYVDDLRGFADCLADGLVLPEAWQLRRLGHRIVVFSGGNTLGEGENRSVAK